MWLRLPFAIGAILKLHNPIAKCAQGCRAPRAGPLAPSTQNLVTGFTVQDMTKDSFNGRFRGLNHQGEGGGGGYVTWGGEGGARGLIVVSVCG